MLLNPIKATGTIWHVEVLNENFDDTKLQTFTEDFLETFEQKYSRFREDSWLNVLNSSGVFLNPDNEFRELLFRSIQMYKKTNGVFNIAIGEKMIASGYDNKYSFIESELSQSPALTSVLLIETNQILLKEASLDLGGIGKGFLIDSLAHAYQNEFGLKYFVINGGGDIYATSNHEDPIIITLTHPQDQKLGIGTVDLFNQGFTASSPYVRAWTDKKTGKEHNHLHN